MLKALELVGFKSFADKTRFEFPSGITVVVGPNGSGKSNVVDAIKWVLGEQRVKSLRGKEMADVIFNGSGSRRPTNTAEITLTFDNSSRLLDIDTPDVHITRRVYRSGEGEYLINRQPCRLRDIRDMISGTGMGTQAYSVIEQGKVDVLLQASPMDRRMIFEEAAGISRFKAKKLEALRRLERVEQNLLRLSDIVDEVESRLRGVRLQAGKARRYKQYTDRLQELRTQAGLVDWQRLSQRLAAFETDFKALADERGESTARAEAVEARLLETDTEMSDVNESIRASEARIAANRERIAAGESTIQHERARGRDLEREVARYRRQLAAMSARAGDLQQQLKEAGTELQSAEEHHRQIARLFAENERELTDLIERLDRIRGEHEQHRTAYVDQMRSAAALGNRISGLNTEVAAALAARRRCQERMADLDRQLIDLRAELDQLGRQRQDLAARLEERTEQCSAAGAQLARRREECTRRQSELAELRQRQSGLAERASVLEELEKRCEGMGTGVKQLLAQARSTTSGPWRWIHGLVADLFHVRVEAAALVEIALGETSQHLVATPSEELLDYLRNQSHAFAGRVGFVWLDNADASAAHSAVDLEGRPGVLGRADRSVETDPKYLPLVRRLLGQTWIVEKLTDALELQRSLGPGEDYVTVAGDLVTADGRLIVGPQLGSTGLISRRSELRALTSQLAELNGEIGQAESAVEQLREQVAADEHRLQTLSNQREQAVEALGQHDRRTSAAEERHHQLDRQRSVLQSELNAASVQHEAAEQSLAEAEAEHKQVESELADSEARVARLADQGGRLEADRQLRDRDATEAKVELAKSEERLRNLRTRVRQFEESQQERHRAIAESREQLTRCCRQAEQSERTVLRAESEIAELYLHKETFARQTVELIDQRDDLRQARSELTAEAQRIRASERRLDEKIHNKELEAGEIRHDRNSLAARLREDYGIELAELEHELSDAEQHQREEVQEEIDQLRRKINNLGNVNIEALEELDQLEARHQTLAGQYRDLADAKTSLERIIDKINVDSRRLFSETLQTVKDHFADLFRDLFGGGQADIVLDEEVDILESGIEIVARPPGKEPRSISLLSGGEKTLTCVALLLAIFRSRPSPFCVLDEVDAALDEANIDRFTKVLEQFLAWTQFIIITHSKKTMTCANTIYGVTMQESGVSKQVSVRFEDVSDDGEILVPAESAEPSEPEAEDDETQAA
ncbi:MAG: chromosome segregation protein SMC [Planctomycetota bacterium]|jgi:chromosome segregation protein